MIRILGFAALALSVAACGSSGGGKSAFVKACVDGGESKALCTCMADGLEDKLDKSTFNKLTRAAAKGDDADMDDILGDLPEAEQMAAGTAIMGVAMTCAMSGLAE